MSLSLRTLALITAGATALGLTGCTAADTADAESVTCPNGKIRFGIEPYEDPASLEPAYRILADALSTQLDCPVEVTIVEDYAAEVLAMQNGQLELAQFGPLGFVFANQRADATPLASFGTADGELSSYTAGIWVAADSPIKSVKDLAGHSLALGSVGSTSGDALPTMALADAGVRDQVNADYTGGHPEALLALTNGTVDAAEINSQTLATAMREGTFDASEFRQVWESDPIPNDPITVRGDLPAEFRDAVQQALVSLAPETVAEVGAFLDVTPPGPMVKVTVDTYRPLFDLADTLGLSEKDV